MWAPVERRRLPKGPVSWPPVTATRAGARASAPDTDDPLLQLFYGEPLTAEAFQEAMRKQMILTTLIASLAGVTAGHAQEQRDFSLLATQTVQHMGLKPVAHIAGGFGAWKAAGGPVEAPEPRR